MAWYDSAVFYHIYPLGLLGAPEKNSYTEPVGRLNDLLPWIGHMKVIGCNALYIGPLFESGSHGYDTTDYRKVDSRLGTNEDLKNFVAQCHSQGIRVILDGVLNHVGRDFFAFQDLKRNRENSPYRDWFCNVNFWGNNEYNDGFSYDNWGGYNLLVKLNQRNWDVQNYLCDSIRMWVSEFDIDGLRLDAADVLDFGFIQTLRQLANEVKPEFWLMGEVIHGDYTRWVNDSMLHSVTDYNLYKALYSGHNDHNYFEIAHTVKRIYDMGMNRPGSYKLYSFADNHDVERIYTILREKEHYIPLLIVLYTLPGIPSIYYGSEFGIEGRKERFTDRTLRPAISLDNYKDALTQNPYTKLISVLGRLRQNVPALYNGDYRELQLSTRQYVFERALNANLDRATLSEISSAIRRDGALTVDLDDLVDAIPPLVRILRYGNARDVEANDLRFLFDALCARLVASLPYAFVSLNEDASLLKLGKLNALIVALNVLNDKEVLDKFFGAFREVVENPASSKIISGRLVRALFENARCEVEELNRYFSFFVSRRNDAKEVAFWLQGFLSGSGQTILWREEIWKTMNRWLVSVDSDVFQELIPLLRRAFSNFEQNERREMGKIVARLKIVAEETRDDATRPTETNELAREEVANDSGDTGGNVDSDGDGATTTPAQKDDERSDSSDPDAIFDPVLSFILGDDVL